MAKVSWFVGGKRHKRKKSNGAALSSIDTEKERDPPPRATPVTFPEHNEHEGRAWGEDMPPPNLQALFSQVLKPSDISSQHAEALNIKTLPPCLLEDLVPSKEDGTSFLLPLAPSNGASMESSFDALYSNPESVRKRREFDERLSELQIDNELASCTLSRTVASGVKPPRLAFMRKFWEGLDCMAPYWDCSLDHYYWTTQYSDEGQKSAKRQRLEDRFITANSEAEQILPIIGGHAFSEAHDDECRDKYGQDQSPNRKSEKDDPLDRKTRSTSATPEPQPRMRYKGRRTSTGREMPDQFRVDTVRAFVEGTIWPFHTALSPPRMIPLVHFNKLNLPVRQTAAVYRVPKDRAKGRQGWLEGPIISLQVRADTDFHDENGQEPLGKARLDLLRETAGLLQLAQERLREGKTPKRPGEGEWWTTKPRWGGGTGGEVQNKLGNSDVVQAAEELLGATREKSSKSEKDSSKGRNKKTPALLWKELKCGRGYWDPKTDYAAIGQHPDSEYDEVFLVSSLNHHISIVKLTVHGSYMEYLTSGSMPNKLPEDVEWCRPRLQRSHWFDLFDMEQRVEAFRGLWGVMAYLTRDIESAAKQESQDSSAGAAQ